MVLMGKVDASRVLMQVWVNGQIHCWSNHEGQGCLNKGRIRPRDFGDGSR
jgi:hypothetical protein